jgi:Tfp pilus assembly protein PilP
MRWFIALVTACAISVVLGAARLADAADKAKAAAAATSSTPSTLGVPPTSMPAGAPDPGMSFIASPYSYNPDGRRDPFQNLAVTNGADPKVPPKPPAAGIAGIRVEELAVRGVMNSRDRLVAMIQGPDNRTYLIHQGDKLADGAVKSITPQGLVLVQDVSDPRAKEKTREIRKLLRAPEDDKE